jgi:hypothetical protein
MKRTRFMLALFAGAVLCAYAPLGYAGDGESNEPGLRIGPGGVVLKNGVPFRAIGVNFFSAFSRTLANPDDTSYRDGFAALRERGVPFCRFMACGFWPIDWNLYLTDKDVYFARFDSFVAAAEETGIGLIPSLFWAYFTVPDVVGEPCNQLGNPDSATIAFIRQYTEEVVSRYVDSPAIWAWEMGNEYNLAADLPNADDHRPPTWTNLGCPATRSDDDELTHEIIVTAFQQFGQAVRLHDGARLITTGNSAPRPSAYHQRIELSWTQDTREQYQQNLLDVTPDPLNLISIHHYPEHPETRFGETDVTTAELLALTTEAGASAGKAVLLGEFGASNAAFGGDPDQIRQLFQETVDAIVASDVALAAAWVYDLPSQSNDWNITVWNNRAYMLEIIGKANDTDGDGVSNYDEANSTFGYVTDQDNPDTDGDGLNDSEEMLATYGHVTNPLMTDSDRDGLNDYDELFVYASNPRSVDTDKDGRHDGQEIEDGTDLLDPASRLPAVLALGAVLLLATIGMTGARALSGMPRRKDR